jgi:hypothetical protein
MGYSGFCKRVCCILHAGAIFGCVPSSMTCLPITNFLDVGDRWLESLMPAPKAQKRGNLRRAAGPPSLPKPPQVVNALHADGSMVQVLVQVRQPHLLQTLCAIHRFRQGGHQVHRCSSAAPSTCALLLAIPNTTVRSLTLSRRLVCVQVGVNDTAPVQGSAMLRIRPYQPACGNLDLLRRSLMPKEQPPPLAVLQRSGRVGASPKLGAPSLPLTPTAPTPGLAHLPAGVQQLCAEAETDKVRHRIDAYKEIMWLVSFSLHDIARIWDGTCSAACRKYTANLRAVSVHYSKAVCSLEVGMRPLLHYGVAEEAAPSGVMPYRHGFCVAHPECSSVAVTKQRNASSTHHASGCQQSAPQTRAVGLCQEPDALGRLDRHAGDAGPKRSTCGVHGNEQKLDGTCVQTAAM